MVEPRGRVGFAVLRRDEKSLPVKFVAVACPVCSGSSLQRCAEELHQPNVILTRCGSPAGLSLMPRGCGWDWR